VATKLYFSIQKGDRVLEMPPECTKLKQAKEILRLHRVLAAHRQIFIDVLKICIFGRCAQFNLSVQLSFRVGAPAKGTPGGAKLLMGFVKVRYLLP
jgi:hypothetical protein